MLTRSLTRPITLLASRYMTGPRVMSGIWTPAALFAAGQQGVWYEPKPEYLYQDSAGTTPVTADGQPVGYIKDLSGNGNHGTQSTAAAKPLYRTDGTLHWLEFDGVDDGLFVTLPSVITYPVVILQSGDATSTEQQSCEVSVADPTSTGSYTQAIRSSGQGIGGLKSTGVYSGGDLAGTVIGGTRGKYVFSSRFYSSGQVSYDGSSTSTALAKPEPTGATRIMIGGLGRSDIFYTDGDFYGAILNQSLLAQSAEDDALKYLANLAGVTL